MQKMNGRGVMHEKDKNTRSEKAGEERHQEIDD